MIDTHAHLYMPDYGEDADFSGQCAAVDRAAAAGVDLIMLANVDRASIEPIRRLHQLRPANTLISMGLHPTELKEDWRDDLAYMFALLDADPSRYKAVGEVGVDLHWEQESLPRQMEAFDMQLSKARELGLPVLIHSRDALPQTLEVLSGHPGVEAVFHSFGGTDTDADAIRRTGDFYFGINGIVTFKNSKLRDVLPHIGLDRLLTETDAPWLAPTPHRGTRNESALMPLVADSMAAALALSPEEVRTATAANARRFFKI